MPFFSPQRVYAVLGASNNSAKFGFKITCWYVDHALPVVPINPTASEIVGEKTCPTIQETLKYIQGQYPGNDGLSLSVLTPPSVTKTALDVDLEGVKSIWFQPGSYDDDCIKLVQSKGIELTADGHCILVEGPSIYVQSKL